MTSAATVHSTPHKKISSGHFPMRQNQVKHQLGPLTSPGLEDFRLNSPRVLLGLNPASGWEVNDSENDQSVFEKLGIHLQRKQSNEPWKTLVRPDLPNRAQSQISMDTSFVPPPVVRYKVLSNGKEYRPRQCAEK
eukprot:6208081-Pleurochrysis_carterae.AAC.2